MFPLFRTIVKFCSTNRLFTDSIFILIYERAQFLRAFRDSVISRQLMVCLRLPAPVIYLITLILRLFHQQRFSKIIRDFVIALTRSPLDTEICLFVDCMHLNEETGKGSPGASYDLIWNNFTHHLGWKSARAWVSAKSKLTPVPRSLVPAQACFV